MGTTRVTGGSGALRTWEYREVSLPRGTPRELARQVLTSEAETGHWELDRLRMLPDGRRRVILRRRVIRAVRTA